MPNSYPNQTAYVFTGNPATVNTSTLYKPGELGSRLVDTNKAWQLVQLDSGATAASPVGVVAATQVAFWKNKSTYTVTNDLVQSGQASGGTADRNLVAGIFPLAVTAGNYCYVQQQGAATVLAASGGTWADAVVAIANSGTAADITSIAAGTAPTYIPLGVVRSGRASTTVTVDLNIPDVP